MESLFELRQKVFTPKAIYAKCCCRVHIKRHAYQVSEAYRRHNSDLLADSPDVAVQHPRHQGDGRPPWEA
jgi:hypothetical protein